MIENKPLRVVTTPNFVPLPPTVDELLKHEAGPEFHVETAKTSYRANHLHEAMCLWRDSGDKDEVVNVGRAG